MANILDILTRAQALRQETALNSITPDRAGGIMYDTLILINQMQLEGGSLLISKVYSSVAAMEADTTPTSDLTGRALRPGQLAVIVPSSSTSSDMGSVYRYNEPGSWTLCGKIGGLPMDTVPIQGSSNGITSGAVYNALSALRDEGYKYMGVATPGSGGTNPGTPHQPVFYVAAAGSYPNFSNLTVASGHLGFLKYSNGSWTVESIEVGKDYDEKISQLEAEVDGKLDRELNTDKLCIIDSNGYVIAEIDVNGVNAYDVRVLIDGNLVSVKSLLATLGGDIAAEQLRAETEEAKKLDKVIDDDALVIMDGNGYIIARIDASGIHSAQDKHAVACMVLGESYYPTSAPTRDSSGNITHANVMFGTGVAGSLDITYANNNASQVVAHYGNYTYTISITRDADGNVQVVTVN